MLQDIQWPQLVVLVSFSSFQNPVTVARMYDTDDRWPSGRERDPVRYGNSTGQECGCRGKCKVDDLKWFLNVNNKLLCKGFNKKCKD